MESLKKDQVFELLLERISNGEYPAGYRFPTEIEFARQLGVGKVTLRSALARLEKQGMVDRRVSQGTFVAKRYVPSEHKFMVIWAVDEDISNPVHYILPGIERRCYELKIELMRAPYEVAQSEPFFRESGSTGVIILGSYFTGNEKILTVLRRMNLPVVIHGIPQDHEITGMAVVTRHSREAWSMGIRYLKSQGHQKIATIWKPGDLRGFGNDYDYKEFLVKNGLMESVPLCRQYNEEEISRGVDELLELSEPPTAIMGYSDFFAWKILDRLKELGIAVPEEMAVMGFCGYPGGAFLEPPLSTIDFGYEHIGAVGVDLLTEANRWFRPGMVSPLVFTPYELVERKSTAIRRKNKIKGE